MFCFLIYQCTSIVASKISFAEHETLSDENSKPLQALLSPYDMKRLEAYTNNHVDYHMVRWLRLFLYDFVFNKMVLVYLGY